MDKEEMMSLLFLAAFVAGLSYSVAPGVINAEALRRGLTHGFCASLLFQIGTLAGVIVWGVIALSSAVVIQSSAGLSLVLELDGLGRLACLLARAWWHGSGAKRTIRSPGWCAALTHEPVYWRVLVEHRRESARYKRAEAIADHDRCHYRRLYLGSSDMERARGKHRILWT